MTVQGLKGDTRTRVSPVPPSPEPVCVDLWGAINLLKGSPSISYPAFSWNTWRGDSSSWCGPARLVHAGYWSTVQMWHRCPPAGNDGPLKNGGKSQHLCNQHPPPGCLCASILGGSAQEWNCCANSQLFPKTNCVGACLTVPRRKARARYGRCRNLGVQSNVSLLL